MPQITIQKGDTLSALAAKHGTSVAELVNANKGNAAVKSADLIIAGGSLNIPEKVSTPAAGPSAEGGSGSLSVAPVQDQGAKAVGDLGNLRTALRSALNEAARKRIENQYRQIAPLSEGVPGTIGSVVDMIRSGIKTPVETTFSDVIQTFQDRQNFALQLSGRYPDSGILASDDPETAARKASRAPSFLKSQKNEPTVAEKEQYEAKSSQSELERKRGEGGFVDLNEYRRMKTRSLLSPTEFDKRFTYFLSDGDQERIRMENASPTTRTAGDFTKGEQVVQANLAQIGNVGAGNMNQFVAQIYSIIQQETNLTDAEINQLIARYGFSKMGSIWIYKATQ